jgi:hypothetical protein
MAIMLMKSLKASLPVCQGSRGKGRSSLFARQQTHGDRLGRLGESSGFLCFPVAMLVAILL